MKKKLQTRVAPLAVSPDGPTTLDEESRSIEVVCATDQPVEVFDWVRGVVREALIMSGLEGPPDQIPLLNTHNRWDATEVKGSVRDLKVEGDKLIGLARFSTADDVENVWAKIREGHLTDFSIGYRVDESVFVEEGTTAKIEGREFEGPIKVVTKWRVTELSICPIGADEQAKARAEAGAIENQKEETMDPKLKAFLEKRGMASGASEEEAWKFLESMELPAREEPASDQDANRQGDQVDTEALQAEAARAEQVRIMEIRDLCQHFDLPDQADELIRANTSIDEARKKVLDRLLEKKSGITDGAGHRGPNVDFVADERDKFRAAAADSLLIKGGIAVEKPAPGAMDLRGMTLREVARECLVKASERTPANPLEMVGRALTTSDFPLVLANVANKGVLAGWEGTQETWPTWCGVGQVSDFKTHTLVRPSETDDLDEIPESGEYEYGKRSEAQEQYNIATFGKLFAISRKTIINDDLNRLIDIPQQHGAAAARKVGDIAYAVLFANSAMGDGKALFISAHSNLMSGAAPGVTSIGTAIKAMKLQKDIAGKRRLNIRPQFFLAPVNLEGQMEQFFRSEFEGTQEKPGLRNIYAGSYFTRVYEPRMDDDDANAWYLAAAKGKTVVVFFLNGVQEPYLETKQGWNVDGVEYKVRIDAGAKAIDWRGLTKNPGES